VLRVRRRLHRRRKQPVQGTTFVGERRRHAIADLVLDRERVDRPVAVVAKPQLFGRELLDGNAAHAGAGRPQQHAVHVSDRRDQAIGHIVLDGEQVALRRLPRVGFAPELRAAPGIDETGGNSNRRASTTDAAVEDVAGTEHPADLPHIGGRVLVLPRGVLGDDGQIGERASAAVMSSVRPSASVRASSSAPRVVNGSTASHNESTTAARADPLPGFGRDPDSSCF
jgi:hypothetical protein